MKGYTLEESFLLGEITRDGSRLDVVKVCLEHGALLSLYHKGAITLDNSQDLETSHKIIHWRLSP